MCSFEKFSTFHVTSALAAHIADQVQVSIDSTLRKQTIRGMEIRTRRTVFRLSPIEKQIINSFMK